MMIRDTSVDIVKGIGIYLMVLCHCGLHNMFTSWVYSFHMPLFFFVSGYLFGMKSCDNSKNFSSFRQYLHYYLIVIKKAFFRIYLPYLFFSLIFCFGKQGYKDWFYLLYGSINAIAVAKSQVPLWFLPCFFASFLLFQLNHLLIKNIFVYLVSIFIGICGFVFSDQVGEMGMPFSVNVSCVGLLLMEAGNVFFVLYTKYGKFKILLIIIGMITCITFSYNLPESWTPTNPHVEMAIGSYGNPLWFMFNSVMCCILLICLFKSIKNNENSLCRMVSYMGKNSLPILLLHSFPISIMMLIFKNDGIKDSIFFVIMMSVVVILFSVMAVKLLRCYIPVIIGE